MKSHPTARSLPIATAALVFALTAPASAGAPFTCSGIGVEEREAAGQVPHSLRVEYAQPDGHYLGYVATRITEGGTEVVNTTCPGPWLLADLPAGTYRVTATYKDRTKTVTVNVAAGKRTRQVIVF